MKHNCLGLISTTSGKIKKSFSGNKNFSYKMGGHQRILNDLWMILIWLFHYPPSLPLVNSTGDKWND
jgi:hypothetical protein